MLAPICNLNHRKIKKFKKFQVLVQDILLLFLKKGLIGTLSCLRIFQKQAAQNILKFQKRKLYGSLSVGLCYYGLVRVRFGSGIGFLWDKTDLKVLDSHHFVYQFKPYLPLKTNIDYAINKKIELSLSVMMNTYLRSIFQKGISSKDKYSYHLALFSLQYNLI